VSRLARNIVLAVVVLAALVPAVLLATGVLPYKVYIVHTGSMTPTIPSRSAVVVHEGAYHVGQVISFESRNGVVTHRLVARKTDGALVTKGDANRTADPGSTTASQVIGGVVAAPRMLGYWLVYLKNPMGAASLFLTIICLWLIYSITMDLAERQQVAQAQEATPSLVSQSAAVNAFETPVPSEASMPHLNDPWLPDIRIPLPARNARYTTPGLGDDHVTRVWRAVPRKSPIVFTCSGCGETFEGTAELRQHKADHGCGSNEADLPFPEAARFLEKRRTARWSSPDTSPIRKTILAP
jgi:signal peptidase I